MDAEALSSFHWGESDRNRERNRGSRNDSALMKLTASTHGAQLTGTMFVQTCGHRDTAVDPDTGEVLSGACPAGDEDCSDVTAIFLGMPGRDIPRFDARVMLRMSRRLRVNAFLVMHGQFDEQGRHSVTVHPVVDGSREDAVETTWEGFAEMLRGEQFRHERGRHPACSSVDVPWLQREDVTGKTRDLSMSNAIREIPGVRHTDIDATLACPSCLRPIALIESTSDGVRPRESVVKSAHTVRSVGRHVGAPVYLVQHRVDDVLHRSPVLLTRWDVTGHNDAYDHDEVDWTEVADDIDFVVDVHHDVLCTHDPG